MDSKETPNGGGHLMVRGVAGSAGIEPLGGGTGTTHTASFDHVVMELRRQTEFIGVGLAPLLDQSGEDFFRSDPSPEPGQLIKKMKLGEVASGELAVQAALETLPPDRCEPGDGGNRMIGFKMGKKGTLQPLLALRGPIGLRSRSLSRTGCGGEALAGRVKGGVAGLPTCTTFRASVHPCQGTEILLLGRFGRLAKVAIGSVTDPFVDRLGGGIEDGFQFGFPKKEAPKANDRAHLGDEADGERRRTLQTTGSPRLPESLDHTPVGELSGPLVGK